MEHNEMKIELERFPTDDYRVSVTTTLPIHPTRVVAVAWCRRDPRDKKSICKKTWAIYHVIDGGGPVCTGLNRRQVCQRLRQLAKVYLEDGAPTGRVTTRMLV